MDAREELIRKRRNDLLANGYIIYANNGDELLGVGLDEPGTGVYTRTLAELPQVHIDALIDQGKLNLAARLRRDSGDQPTTIPTENDSG